MSKLTDGRLQVSPKQGLTDSFTIAWHRGSRFTMPIFHLSPKISILRSNLVLFPCVPFDTNLLCYLIILQNLDYSGGLVSGLISSYGTCSRKDPQQAPPRDPPSISALHFRLDQITICRLAIDTKSWCVFHAFMQKGRALRPWFSDWHFWPLSVHERS
jgi:hypothetical protein